MFMRLLKFPCNLLPVPQMSSKPSLPKRRCSEENSQLGPDEENMVPAMTRAVAPVLSDPLTDKKPPVGPAGVRSSSSLEKGSTEPVVLCQPKGLTAAHPENTPCPDPLSNREALTASPVSAPLGDNPSSSVTGMKSRLQRLAEHRKCWDGDDGKWV